MKLRTDKKKITLFGRAIPMTLIVALMVVGIASAALLTYYSTIEGTLIAEQAVLVDGGDYMQNNAYSADGVEGMTITTEHTLENQAQVPATVEILTTSTVPDAIGITTSYQVGELITRGSGVSELAIKDEKQAIRIEADLITAYPPSNEGTVVVKLPAGTTLGGLSSISWSAWTNSGYIPHVDIILDTNGDNVKDEALVAEGAHQNNNAVTGWTMATWLETFEGASGVYTPGRGIDDPVGQIAEEVKSVQGKTAVWLSNNDASVLNKLSDYQTTTPLNGISASTPVLALEIEVDGWVVASESFVKSVTINGVKYPVLSSDNKLTINSGDTVGFFIRNGFDIALSGDTYTITTKVQPTT